MALIYSDSLHTLIIKVKFHTPFLHKQAQGFRLKNSAPFIKRSNLSAFPFCEVSLCL